MDWTDSVPAIFLWLVWPSVRPDPWLRHFSRLVQAASRHVLNGGELREERKAMLLDYPRAAQEAHDYAARLWEGGPDLPDEPARRLEAVRLDSEMWFQTMRRKGIARSLENGQVQTEVVHPVLAVTHDSPAS